MELQHQVANVGRALPVHGFCYCGPKDNDMTPEEFKDLVEFFNPNWQDQLEVADIRDNGHFTIRFKR